MMWSYFVGLKMKRLVVGSSDAAPRTPVDIAQVSEAETRLAPFQPTVVTASKTTSAKAPVTTPTASTFEDSILRFPVYAEREKLLETGDFRKLVNTRWDLKDSWPFAQVGVIDFYDNNLARFQRADYYEEVGEEWYLWRLKSESELEVFLIAGTYPGSEEMERVWYVDGYDGAAPEKWETHAISFSYQTKDPWGNTITTLNGFYPRPLIFS